MTTTIVVGLDPGSRIIGLCALEVDPHHEVLVELQHHDITATEKTERLAFIENRIVRFLEKHHPSHVAVESGFVGVNPQSTLVLAEARGVAILAAGKTGAKVFEVSPSSIRCAIGLGPVSKKIDIQQRICAMLKLEKAPTEDEADAAAIAIWMAHRAFGQAELSKDRSWK
jgi:crossover junction endodeoxyribonuclease RuvC